MSPRKPAALRDGGGEQSLREHLVAAAQRLIARRGTVGLTVREIAREARVADGVLYNHFAGSDELIGQALHAHVNAVLQTMPEPPRPGSGTLAGNLHAHIGRGLELLSAVIPAFAGLMARPKVLASLHGESAGQTGQPVLHVVLGDYLRAEQRLGRVARSAKVDAAATMIIGACHELVLPHVFRGRTEPVEVPPGFVEDVVATVLRGIAPSSE